MKIDDQPRRGSIRVIGSVFNGGGKPGDFKWMIRQPEYDDALFIFNDNEEAFLAHLQDPSGKSGCSPGGGNAAIRPYRGQNPPRAAGIPTGVDGAGYPRLTDTVKQTIDSAISKIQAFVATGRYSRIIFSAADESGNDLGTGIFEVGADVRRYIVQGLRALEGE